MMLILLLAAVLLLWPQGVHAEEPRKKAEAGAKDESGAKDEAGAKDERGVKPLHPEGLPYAPETVIPSRKTTKEEIIITMGALLLPAPRSAPE